MNHILYHANCADGFASATIMHRHLLNNLRLPEPSFRFQPVNYQWQEQLPPQIAPNDGVVYLDYTPPLQAIDAIAAAGASLLVIDHHESRQDFHDTRLTKEESIFDLDQSGCMLTWRHCFPLWTTPLAVVLIEHRDLGRAFQDPEHPHSRDALNLHAYLFRLLPRTFEAWSAILFDSTATQKAIQDGAKLRKADQLIIHAAAVDAHVLLIDEFKIPAVNGLDAGLISDACDRMLKDYPDVPFVASWYVDHKSNKVVYSLRSRKNGFNVAEFAQTKGGGGHACAAGFSTAKPYPLA